MTLLPLPLEIDPLLQVETATGITADDLLSSCSLFTVSQCSCITCRRHLSAHTTATPLPQPPPPIISPSPLYGFPSASSPPEPPQAAPPTGSGRTHSRTQSYSSNHSYPHPPAQLPNSGPPPTLYHSGSTAQRPRRHSSRAGSHVDLQQSSSHNSNGISPSRRHGHGPPSIVYAPSANSSSYAYNPPIITNHPPPSMTIHAPTPHHAHPQRMAQSISDPTPVGGSLGRSSTRGRLFEDFSRTPSPNTARARAKESGKKDKSYRDKLRRKQRDGGGRGADNDDHDDGASVSSGSTYYVLPSPGQKIKVVVSVLLYCLALALRRQDLSNCYRARAASTEFNEGALRRA
ncbi:hypothetical protein BJV77DRAFT_475235 [Russula vinacea]|nr:hypothetical protein BJV77DRAFT_475235 [Russula vinacea]